jgi:hypothetical protein
MPVSSDAFLPSERAIFRRLSKPFQIQSYLDEITYNKEPGGVTCRSPRLVMRDRVAHCMEGAMFAAAVLSFHGYPPLVLDLEAVQDDDHVLAVFQQNGLWGAIAKSNYSGLRYREPVYRTVREMVMTYFEHYFNLRGKRSLRAFSRPVSLKRFDSIEWRTTEEHVWEVPSYLVEVKHYPLFPAVVERRLTRADKRLFEAGKVGLVK